MTLIETASHSGEVYSYIHFFQGADLPIKTQDEIHAFFEGDPQKNYVSIERQRSCMAQNKCWYRHLFCHNRFFRKNRIVKALNFGLVAVQKALKIKMNQDIELYQGSALFSITGECARFVESRKAEIKRRFRYSLAADEVFLQSILMDSEYRETISKVDSETSSNARFIDRTRPDGKNSPHIWRAHEIDFLLGLPDEFCFARKFDEKVAPEAVTLLMKEIEKKAERLK